MAQSKTLSRKAGKAGLTTHVLDTAKGVPAAGVKIALYALGDARLLIASSSTNEDGRVDGPLLEGDSFKAGRYELVFHIGDYFAKQGFVLPEPKFIDEVVIRFGLADTLAHYHVPLLVSPYSYSTYRGS
jgi:5-hydroxyisourate hydrolase